ncbi:MAG: glycosyltransferase family 4 protein [Sandaracinaceae bacterium]|nr:glycosyltransferase family 4 protein [Sandaracinaceae bacterium]
MKIGFALPRGRHAGGIERYAFELSEDLRARGHRCVLLADGAVDPAYAAGFDEHRTLDAGSGLSVIYAQKAELAERLPASVPLLVAAHDHDDTCVRSHRYLPRDHSPCHRAPGLGCVTNGCFVVRTREGRLPFGLRDPFSLRSRVRELSRRATFVACSRYVQDRLLEAGAERVTVVHPVPRDAQLEPTRRPRSMSLLVVAQLVRGKGVDVAIRALAHLPGARLVVAGDGAQRGELEALAAEAAPDLVTFLGQVGKDDVGALYDACSVALVPSRWPEPFGMVGLEAMGRGRPVAGADHGGIPEWLDDDGGARFRPNDPVDLAAVVRALDARDDAEARAVLSRARFSRAATVERLEALLEAAC